MDQWVMDKEPNEGGAAGYQTRKDAGRDAFSPATGAITKSIGLHLTYMGMVLKPGKQAV